MMRRGGSVLILALWSLLVLGALAVAVGGLVSAQVNRARYLKEDATARRLAASGIELAMVEMGLNPTNALIDDERFRDNRSLPDGQFSVYFTYVTNLDSRALFVTNFGIASMWEPWRINLDSRSESNRLERVLGGDQGVAENILTYNSNGVYESFQQILAVPGVDFGHFQLLEPVATLSRYRLWTFEGKRYRRESYGGTAVGQAMATGRAGDQAVTATRRITFVYDVLSTNFLYWREH